jgi:murein tripeptide amidase MpaA
MHISAAFDSGNIDVVDASDPNDVRLAIRTDHGSDFYQWFHFRVSGACGVPLTLALENAGGAAYAKGWPGYRAVVSVDRETWVRATTTYEDGVLRIHHTPEADAVWFAYFAPYSFERHQDLLGDCLLSDRVRLETLGETLDGRPLDLLTVGEPGEGRRNLWVICRQHPGEAMAEWWAEGFLARLVDEDDALARWLLDRAVVRVVPNMNPDGSARGHLRTNAAGANLNREWAAPTMERSPEVKLVQDAMDATGVDLLLDVHGDELIRANFIAGTEGVDDWDDRREQLLARFKDAYATANPDFQTKLGYPRNTPGNANLTFASNQAAKRYGCLAMTLEMPFEDCVGTPDELFGWSPARCCKLGASVLHPIGAVLDDLR